MKPFPESELAPSIGKALDALSAAKLSLVDALASTQSACEHRIVSEMPYRTVGRRAAHRICNHCRMIEEGSHWSGGSTWSRHDHGKSDLGNAKGRIVLPISSEEFWKMRVST